MKKILFSFLLLLGVNVYADPPVITYNVHVMQNASSSQCSGSFRQDASPYAMTDVTRIGQGTAESPGLRSCTGCAVDPATQDCVCKRCYEYFNN